MKKQMYWYARDLEAYGKDTQHLSIIEHGAYTLLLDHYYRTQSRLPANAEKLHRICRAMTEQERSAVDAVVSEFFDLDAEAGVYFNGRADKEIEKVKEISGKRSSAASTRYANAPQVQSKADAKADTSTSTSTKEQEQAQQAARSSRRVRLSTYLETVKERGEKFLANDDPIYDYIASIGMSVEMLRLAWLKFEERYREKDKRYIDWPAVFRDSVRNRWMRLWYLDDHGQMQLTQDGKLALAQFKDDEIVKRGRA